MGSVELSFEPLEKPPWVIEEHWVKFLDGRAQVIVEEEAALDAALNSMDSATRREALLARTAKIVLGDRLDHDRATNERFLDEHPGEQPPGMSERSRAIFRRGAVDYKFRFR